MLREGARAPLKQQVWIPWHSQDRVGGCAWRRELLGGCAMDNIMDIRAQELLKSRECWQERAEMGLFI